MAILPRHAVVEHNDELIHHHAQQERGGAVPLAYRCAARTKQRAFLRPPRGENTINFDFCTADGRMLKTVIQFNPGLILLKEGIVVNKWADIDVPAEEYLTKPFN